MFFCVFDARRRVNSATHNNGYRLINPHSLAHIIPRPLDIDFEHIRTAMVELAHEFLKGEHLLINAPLPAAEA